MKKLPVKSLTKKLSGRGNEEIKDLMNKAGELFEKDYNVFLHFSVAALYFVVISMMIFFVFGLVQKYLSRHIRKDERQKLKLKPNYMR